MYIRHGQGHVLKWWEELKTVERDQLVKDLSDVDLAEKSIRGLVETVLVRAGTCPPWSLLTPPSLSPSRHPALTH